MKRFAVLAGFLTLMVPAVLIAAPAAVPPASAPSSEALLSSIFSADPAAPAPALPDIAPQAQERLPNCSSWCMQNGWICRQTHQMCGGICDEQPDGTFLCYCGCKESF
jgi:hypothetical protein